MLRKRLAKIYGLASLAVVRRFPGAARTGRPRGSTRFDEQVFARDLFERYRAQPPDQRSRADLAKAMGISRRTLHRYLDRWDLAWPPSELETLEDVLARLAKSQDPP